MLPRVILHNSVSADSRTDWINIHSELNNKLISRWNEDTQLIGSDYILNPAGEIPPEDETVFQPGEDIPDDNRPLLVVPDSGGRIRTWHYLKKQSNWRKLIVLCTESTPPNYFDYLKERYIDWIIAGTDNVDFAEAFEELNARYGSKIIRVDCGGSLNGMLLRNSLVDEVSLFIHPLLIGGTSQQSFFRAKDLNNPKGIIALKLIHMEKFPGDYIWLVYKVVNKKNNL